MIKIAIVDDHVLVTQSLVQLLNSLENFEVVETFKNGQELLHYLKVNTDFRPDVTLLDLSMPILDGFKTMEILGRDYPELKVLALTMDDHEFSIIRMLKFGAKGYLLKSSHPDRLKEAIEITHEKGIYASDLTAHAMLKLMSGENLVDHLTERELHFAKLACSEKTYKQIAEEMFVSPKTVDNYRDSVFSKLDVKNRIGLVLTMIKIDPSLFKF